MIENLKEFVPNVQWLLPEGRGLSGNIEIIITPVLVPLLYFHELGHALALKLFYSNAKCSIHLDFNGHGITKYNNATPSRIGRLFGHRAREIISTAAGPVAELISSVALAAFGIALKSNLTVCKVLCAYSCISSTRNFFHSAIGGFAGLDDHNDIATLKRYGIHPIFPVVVTAIPCVITICITHMFFKFGRLSI